MSGFSFGGTQRRMQSGDEDQRYRITVVLVAEKRPRYWDFHCNKCRAKVTEVSGTMVAANDASDLNAVPDYQPAPFLAECPGKWCRFWYEFVTLSGK